MVLARAAEGKGNTMTMNGDMTVPAALERAEEQMTMTNLAESTRRAYRLEIRRFFDSVGKEPSEVAATDLRGWVLGRIESGLAPATVNITTEWSIAAGGHARTGLEDNVRLDGDTLAPSNAALVRCTVDICARHDRNVATPAEARKILGLAPAA